MSAYHYPEDGTYVDMLYTIGPEEGEYGGTVVTVMCRADTQVPFALVYAVEDDPGPGPAPDPPEAWEIVLNGEWDWVKGLADLAGTQYPTAQEAVRVLRVTNAAAVESLVLGNVS